MGSRQGSGGRQKKRKNDTSHANGSTKSRSGKRQRVASTEPNDEESLNSETDNAHKSELEKMKERFAAMVGDVETKEQVAAASQWMTSMQCTKADVNKFKTFNDHMEGSGLSSVW
jgi:hypothetical protein